MAINSSQPWSATKSSQWLDRRTAFLLADEARITIPLIFT